MVWAISSQKLYDLLNPTVIVTELKERAVLETSFLQDDSQAAVV